VILTNVVVGSRGGFANNSFREEDRYTRSLGITTQLD
jgi:hypothetical protein